MGDIEAISWYTHDMKQKYVAFLPTVTKIFSLSICLTCLSCVSSVGVAKAQRPTISPEAQAFLDKGKTWRIPALPLTEGMAETVGRRMSEDSRTAVETHGPGTGVRLQKGAIAEIPVVTAFPQDYTEEAIGLYIHGGAFIGGEAADWFLLDISRKLGFPVISVSYSLSPAVAYPTALEEVYGVYRTLISTYPKKPIVLMGLSAGGNLALALSLKAREEGLPLPAALVLCTPWTDLTGTGDTYHANDGRDILAWKRSLDKTVGLYVQNGEDLRHPYISPIYARFDGNFPPTIITTGTRDLFLSNCVRLDTALRSKGAPSRLLIYEGMWHAFNNEPGIPEGDVCNREISETVKSIILKQPSNQ
jgi:acetyl esterase/lipase